ncbi:MULTISPECIES: transporter substrate-binding domain-containing protein [unclassified Undibacterium]|uniref:transporter substrate-binding domain-containing protein n=2 Tax=Undibacterium TaxID=401469 RepID=UPI002AC8B5AB|nr:MULTISPECIES: transporter substrate-binding domain-containing protein [unclassified Undibacterium]MEB0139781.1 transporter substrate-binding domain-containing protein [Undibacterium sp. CCC2.1]MEB0170511.1 transporter substrate-binding domain-containing protein [Undibacterium sp. CCC1.1]MEB0174452.1 transporter substrate-binding domain-containing protein [Undibacterium sp. CCC3.4]MEB0213751.1 transporter substrate-binding domain-containing protein [Undibacterium sp. 5I2]WPX45570.1 transport
MPVSFIRSAVSASLLALGLVLASSHASAADLLDTVHARGSLKIAVEGTYPPFNFTDQKTHALSGFDVDVARLLAAKLGVKAEFVTIEWSGILAGLSAGKFDVIVNQVGITPKRAESFDFSTPYTLSAAQLVVRKDEQRSFTSLVDLKGKKLGVAQGSNYEERAKASAGIDVKSYPGAPEYLQDLAAGRIDAALNDSLMVAYLLKNSPLPIKAGAAIGEVTSNGIPFVKGNPKFAAALNQALAAISKDGSLAQASIKWFGRDVSKAPAAQ